MSRLTLARWVAALMLAVVTPPPSASAQEADTLSISGTFNMDQLSGTVGADLAAVYTHDNAHVWTLTLYGVTYSYEEIYDHENDIDYYFTRVHAASFDIEFFGPDAGVLNEVVSSQLTRSSLGDDVFLELRNVYSYGGLYPGDSSWDLELLPFDASTGITFLAGAWDRYLTGVWFPTDETGYGYPVVEPQRITSQQTSIRDSRNGNSGALLSYDDLVDIGSSGPPDLPPTLRILDGSVREGNRGTNRLDLTVTLSRTSSDMVSVNYATASGTALVNKDYYATSGTLTFWPGQTQGTISIPIKTDRKRERNETFSVQLSNAVGATIDDGVATATILNDD